MSTQDKHHVSFAELGCCCLIKDLATASLLEYVATHSHQTDHLAPLQYSTRVVIPAEVWSFLRGLWHLFSLLVILLLISAASSSDLSSRSLSHSILLTSNCIPAFTLQQHGQKGQNLIRSGIDDLTTILSDTEGPSLLQEYAAVYLSVRTLRSIQENSASQSIQRFTSESSSHLPAAISFCTYSRRSDFCHNASLSLQHSQEQECTPGNVFWFLVAPAAARSNSTCHSVMSSVCPSGCPSQDRHLFFFFQNFFHPNFFLQ